MTKVDSGAKAVYISAQGSSSIEGSGCPARVFRLLGETLVFKYSAMSKVYSKDDTVDTGDTLK